MSTKILKILKQASKNKIVGYLITRYAVYAIQFIVSIACAAKMGPYYYGIWGFIMMLLNYMQRIDLGIPNAMNIILVQEKDNKEEFARTQSTGFLLLSFLCIGVLLFASGNNILGYGFMEKYPVGWLFYIICIVAMISYFVSASTGIYRVRHKLAEIALTQSITPILLLIALFLANGKELLIWFTLAYLIGNIISLCIFILGGKLSLNVNPKKSMANRIFIKGFYLFLYNACFYFIMISTRTVISSYYPVEQFGYFTFAFSLADAVILLLGAFTFLIFPKLIAKLNTSDTKQVKDTITQLRNNYIPLVHAMMYVAFLFFPVIIMIFPKYEPALPAMYMVGLVLIMEVNASGYVDFLMARNKDKTIALVSGVSLFINVIVSLVLVRVFNCEYHYVLVATLLSYWFYSLICIIIGFRNMNVQTTFVAVIKENLPLRLLVPYLSASLLVVMHSYWLLPLPFVLFVSLNFSTIEQLYKTFRRILGNPNILDIKGI